MEANLKKTLGSCTWVFTVAVINSLSCFARHYFGTNIEKTHRKLFTKIASSDCVLILVHLFKKKNPLNQVNHI